MNTIATPPLTNMHLFRLCAEQSDAPIRSAEARLRAFATRVMGADLHELNEAQRREIVRLIQAGAIRAEGFDF